MQCISYARQDALVENAQLLAALDDGIEWQGTVARRINDLESMRRIEIQYGDDRLALVVADFAERADGTTWIRAVDPARVAARYDGESFSTSPDGSSIGRAIESRIPVASAPPSLYRLIPAIQVDASLVQLLDDAAAELDLHWWYDGAGLTIGAVDGAESSLFAEWVARTPRGAIWRASGGADAALPPLPGRSIQVRSSGKHGAQGPILRLDVRFSSTNWTAELCVGNPAPPARCPSRAEQIVECEVTSLKPFEVEYKSGPRAVRTQAVPLEIAASGEQVRVKLPIAVGDRGSLLLGVLGVARRAPRYWPWRPAEALATDVTIVAPTLIVDCDEQTHHSQQVSYPEVQRFSIA